MKFLSNEKLLELFPEHHDHIMKAEYKTACGCVSCIIMMIERDYGVNLWEKIPKIYGGYLEK